MDKSSIINASPFQYFNAHISVTLAHTLYKYYEVSATYHSTAMQPCSMIALLLAVQIISIQPVKGSDDEDHELMDGIIPYLIKSAQYYIQHEKEKLSILPLPGYAVMYTTYFLSYFDLSFVTFILHSEVNLRTTTTVMKTVMGAGVKMNMVNMMKMMKMALPSSGSLSVTLG